MVLIFLLYGSATRRNQMGWLMYLFFTSTTYYLNEKLPLCCCQEWHKRRGLVYSADLDSSQSTEVNGFIKGSLCLGLHLNPFPFLAICPSKIHLRYFFSQGQRYSIFRPWEEKQLKALCVVVLFKGTVAGGEGLAERLLIITALQNGFSFLKNVGESDMKILCPSSARRNSQWNWTTCIHTPRE